MDSVQQGINALEILTAIFAFLAAALGLMGLSDFRNNQKAMTDRAIDREEKAKNNERRLNYLIALLEKNKWRELEALYVEAKKTRPDGKPKNFKLSITGQIDHKPPL